MPKYRMNLLQKKFTESIIIFNIDCYQGIKFLIYLSLHDSIDFIMGLKITQSVI